MGLNQKAKCWGELHWEHQPPNDPQFWNCSADAGFDQGFWRINFVSPLLGDLSTFQGKFWIHYEVSTLRVIVPTFQANSLSRWWPFAIHNILWHSRTLQVGYSTTSKPPVSKPGFINPGWWFSMDYPQNHPRLVIKSLLEMPSASPALESNPGLWTTIADLGVHAGKATIRRLAFSQDQHQWFLAVLYVGAFSTFTNTYWDNFSKLGCYPHIGFTID